MVEAASKKEDHRTNRLGKERIGGFTPAEHLEVATVSR
jgi:hypothetical protein